MRFNNCGKMCLWVQCVYEEGAYIEIGISLWHLLIMFIDDGPFIAVPI